MPKEKNEIKKTEEDRKNQLLMDHSEMLSRLIIFLGAGMSIRTAWDKIAEDYKRAVNEGRSECIMYMKKCILQAVS